MQSEHPKQYAERFQIHLDGIAPQVALYPSPDNVVPVTECAGMVLDGCFIGACTTAEEELILAGLLLEAGLREGMHIERVWHDKSHIVL